MDKPQRRILVATGVSALAGLLLLRRLRRQQTTSTTTPPPPPALPASWFSAQSDKPSEQASAFTVKLDAVDKDPSGRCGGLSSLSLSDAENSSGWVPLDQLFARPDVMLYCVDFKHQVLIFLEVHDRVLVDGEPFLDRAIRKHAKDDGGFAYLMSFTDALAWSESSDKEWLLLPDGGVATVTWVWNTGRCGSTLMHRALLAAGVASVSEPRWFDEVANAAAAIGGGGGDDDDDQEEDRLARLLRACHALEYAQRRKLAVDSGAAAPRTYSLNPKAFGIRVLRLVRRASFRGAGANSSSSSSSWQRHIFMYRDCDQVTESFGSIFLGSSETAAARRRRSALCSLRRLSAVSAQATDVMLALLRSTSSLLLGTGGSGGGGPPARRPLSLAMRDFHGGGGGGGGGSCSSPLPPPPLPPSIETPLARLQRCASHPFVSSMCLGWMDTVSLWVEFEESEGGGAAEDGQQMCCSLRMAEFVSKGDEPTRRSIMERLLTLAGVLGNESADEREATLDRALEVFSQHSQKGSAMERSSALVASRKFLLPSDREEVRRCAAAVPLLAARGGAALLLPGSLNKANVT